MTLIDKDQRKEATNPFESFIVQAPAGSGKTEILTQRYLRLLSIVNAPEQIIALTFTRKAASEMRERILLALQQASMNQQASSAHQQLTLQFAHDALKRSHLLGWDLLNQPIRLKINTIDSLCQSINQAIPLLDKQIAYPKITEKANTHYTHAARNCIQFALDTSEYHTAITTLLIHVDNRQDRLIELFKTLLSQRDQWITLLFHARSQEKSTFEQALKLIEHHELLRLKESLPYSIADNLVILTRELASIENDPESPRYLLNHWTEYKEINQEIAIALTTLLLTGSGEFRKAFDHYIGLKRGSCPDHQFEKLKLESKELLSTLAECTDFFDALIQVSRLPKPEYAPEQWEVLQALFALLPLLIGHLHLYFSELNEVDFTAISQNALHALGDTENPTDLALYLDNAIHHLLVDEFQDTSITQFDLLNKLIQGWQPGDGKTLFLVGDPMQSIYRFRQAEVGLFFQAMEQGIGPVHLTSLQLSCNFRSTKTIVNWVNHHFSNIFPQQFDIESGAVSYHPSVNVMDDTKNSAIQAFEFNNREQEAKKLIQMVTDELENNPEQSLAILVRSRTQLIEIIKLLRQNKIPYQGTDIDLLSNLPHIRDVWSLTQALLYPANRLAWLAVLRSPYCGLSLNDIHSIAQYNKKKSIYQALLKLEAIPYLSEEGLARGRFFINVMHEALSQRYQNHLSEWVLSTLNKLHSEKILQQHQHDDLEQFWTLLDRYEEHGRIPDMKEFLIELNHLYSQQATPSRLQVMTIHKSKGLEFDTVFLPGLGSQPNHGDKPLLRWLKLPSQQHGTLLLVSPIQAAQHQNDALYDYLGQIDSEKSNYESQRLLYVAVTRAKSRLYLLDSASKSTKGSFRNLLKLQEFVCQDNADAVEETTYPIPKLTKLPLEQYTAHKTNLESDNHQKSLPVSTNTQRLLGIVTHQILQWICTHHPENVNQIPWNLAHYELKRMGLNETNHQIALATLKDQLSNMFSDPVGSWIMAKQDQEKNEYELLVKEHNKLSTRIIDRTFEENDSLWIIDFKTGNEAEESLINYKQQLNEYATHLSTRTHLTIRCGLYYLTNNHWINWIFTPLTAV